VHTRSAALKSAQGNAGHEGKQVSVARTVAEWHLSAAVFAGSTRPRTAARAPVSYSAGRMRALARALAGKCTLVSMPCWSISGGDEPGDPKHRARSRIR